jgi:hypothetical protein
MAGSQAANVKRPAQSGEDKLTKSKNFKQAFMSSF